MIAEQAEAVVPYLARYQPARWRVQLVPLAILPAVLCFSWVAALVLLVAAPLIPLFMAIVGWRAKAASEAQMLEQGGMNAFLLDRLRGLATLRALGAVDATALRLRAMRRDSLKPRTMAVLRIAFLSSAVLELFAALGVAMVAVYVGFHLLGQLRVRHLGRAAAAWARACSSCCWRRPSSSRCASCRRSGTTARPARRRWTRSTSSRTARRRCRVRSAQRRTRRRGARPAPPDIAIRGPAASRMRGETPFLDGFHCRVAAGEHVALFGPSGSGKSSLLALIAGLVPARARRASRSAACR